MELSVDRDLCEANAVCCGIAPEIFELDADEVLVIKVPTLGEDRPDQLELARKAVERCPRNALELRQ